jgi:hypothetical protein
MGGTDMASLPNLNWQACQTPFQCSSNVSLALAQLLEESQVIAVLQANIYQAHTKCDECFDLAKLK